MKSWNDAKKKLEQDFLAPSLRGRVSYFMTRYTHAHDEAGRVAVRVDGREVLQGYDMDWWANSSEYKAEALRRFPEIAALRTPEEKWERICSVATDLGCISTWDFYDAFETFENEPIEESLNGKNGLVRLFAILDRRVGKRRLRALWDAGWGREPPWLLPFFCLRLEAEGLRVSPDGTPASPAETGEAETVREQYQTTEKLSRRISIHEKYSTNKQGFGPWIAAHYDFPAGARVLELGCGTGSAWKGQEALIRRCSELRLTDLSPAMVAAARETLGTAAPLRYGVENVQRLPFPGASFDAVIANMMLYHVPDLQRALTEVRRVLKPGGSFYAATYGEHGIVEALCRILAPLGLQDETNKRFTLQNGGAVLGDFFSEVRRFDYPDSLRVTDMEDVVDYLLSLPSMEAARALPREALRERLAAAMEDGALELPKEYGLFVAK